MAPCSRTSTSTSHPAGSRGTPGRSAPAQSQAWQANVRRALVNSFGFTGTIACAVLEEPRGRHLAQTRAPEPGGGHVLTLSAKTVPSLAGQIVDTTACWRRPDIDVADLCYTANVGRAHFRHRVAGVVTNHAGLAALLETWLSQSRAANCPARVPQSRIPLHRPGRPLPRNVRRAGQAASRVRRRA